MVLGYFCTYGYIALILIIAEVSGKLHVLRQEGRRKLVHILLVFTWMIMLHFFQGTIHMILIPASFVLINMLSYKTAKKADGVTIPVLSAMERSGSEETPGTVYYAFSMMIMGIVSVIWKELTVPCGMGLFCMAFGDGFAGIIGKRSRGVFAKKIRKDKSLGGSMACFLCSILGCMLLQMWMGYPIQWAKLILLGVLSTALEMTENGLDNITVPFGCMLAAAIF